MNPQLFQNNNNNKTGGNVNMEAFNMGFSNMAVNPNSGKPPIAQQPVAAQMRGAAPVPRLNLNQVNGNNNINANAMRGANSKQPTVSQTARPSSRGAVGIRGGGGGGGAAPKKVDEQPGHRLEDFGLPQSARMALPTDNPVIPTNFDLQFSSDTPIVATIPPDILAAMSSATDEDRPSTRRSRLRSRGGTEYLASVEASTSNPNPTPQTAIGPLEVNADGTIAVENNAVPTQVVYAQAPSERQRSSVDGGRKGKHITENQTQGNSDQYGMAMLNPRDMALRNKQMANGTIGANGVYR